MNQKMIRLFIVGLLILAVMIMSGCAKEEAGETTVPTPASTYTHTPTPTPAPAAFSTSDLSIKPTEVVSGETVAITVSVANTGDIEGSYTVILRIDDVNEAEKSVTVAAGSSQTVSFDVTKEKAGSYDVAVDELSGSFTVATPLPLQARGWEGVTVSSLCLKVEQSYPQIEGEFSEPIAEAVQGVLGRIGVQVVGEGEPCDATLTFTLSFRATGASYTGSGFSGSKFLYTGASATGRLELVGEGGATLSLSVSKSYSPPSGFGYSGEPPSEPRDAPFDEAWCPALLDGLSRLWGQWVLVEALANYSTSSAAYDMLAEMKGRAVPILIQALENQDRGVRWGAAWVLGEIGPEAKEAVPALSKALVEDEDAMVRQQAAEALRDIGPAAKEAVPALIQALKDENEDVRMYAAIALGKIGDARAVETLFQALKDENKDVRGAAARALEKLGWKPKSDTEKAWYLFAKNDLDELVALGEAAVEPLIQSLKDGDWQVRDAAKEALVKIGELAVEPLIQTLKDENEWVRYHAAEALGEIGDERAIEPLTQALEDENEDVRRAAEEALRKIRGY